MTRARDYLGSFRLVRLIRAGQTCQVWEAINDVDGRRVAIKSLQPEQRKNKQEIEYLRHEYEVGKNLKHENVIEIYEFIVDRRVPFLVLELSLGKNMKLMLRQHIDTLHERADEIILQSAAGLQYLHEAGWLHCDVKPDNFLVNSDGTVKLIDFAIAQRLRKGGLSKLFGGKSRTVAGTRSYMSPEQILNKRLDERADIYSFGCLLFEFLSGKLPFTGSTPEELLSKHLRAGIPSLQAVNKNVTKEVSDLAISMMAKKPGDRPESFKQFQQIFGNIRVFRTRPKKPVTSDE